MYEVVGRSANTQRLKIINLQTFALNFALLKNNFDWCYRWVRQFPNASIPNLLSLNLEEILRVFDAYLIRAQYLIHLKNRILSIV